MELITPQACSEAVNRLSAREREILVLLCKGLTCEAAGNLMGVKASTAASFRVSLYKKLNVGSAAQAAVIAAKAGVV